MATIVRYFAGWCERPPGEMQPEDGDGRFKILRYQPLGVCAGIAAWNATLVFLCMKAIPAIAAGNTFIFKSSEKSPLGSLAFGELVKKVGFPPGIINNPTTWVDRGAARFSYGQQAAGGNGDLIVGVGGKS